ncbi:ABC transporter permease [Actinoalloteichus spitiensis]|uniref:ABC transporter permease n=1 Tax=Actinoalloteichus spitiensis TaxID=252394 RepID=UPI0009FE9053|nr:ABC transporter permease subunit [Actinoalloteichus spitiensis]
MIQQLIEWLADPAHWRGPDGIPTRLLEHLYYCLVAAGFATLVALPAGLFVGHTGRGGTLLVGAGNALRALPTLGLVTFLYLVVGGTQTATLIGLVVLAVPPILAGAYSGVQQVDRRVVDAAVGVGMTRWQRLWQVEVPNAMPLILGGIRNAVLQVVATAAVAAYVGLGGLGRYVLDGIRAVDYPKVLAGALLVALLAILLDVVLSGVQWLVVPAGLRTAGVGDEGRRRPRRSARREVRGETTDTGGGRVDGRAGHGLRKR